jgi:ubiquinone/menaquinone biosynthesis C-methylase UbiE
MSDDHVKSTIAVYNSIATQYALQAEAHAPAQEREKFTGMIPKGGKVLDAGCGSGRDAAYFETKDIGVVGIDLSDSLLVIARKVAANAEFINMDLRKMDFPDNKFDGIWACASIIHLKRVEIPPVLATFFRILKPGGVLMVMVKAGTRDEFTAEPSIPDKSRYYTYFSKKDIKDYITRAGFAVTEIYSYNEAERFPDGYPTDWIACFAQKSPA